MKKIISLCVLIIFASPLTAQDLSIFEEVTAGNFFGYGAKQMAMGGAGIANTIDGSALYYNPAALARIPRIEFQLGMSHENFSNETSMKSGRYDPTAFRSILNKASADMTKTRFGSVNLTIPVPTYRGSMVVAFGVNRVMSFDRTALFHVRDVRIADNALVEDKAEEFEDGCIYLYSAGAGIDLTPRLSVGASLNVYSGEDKFTYDYTWVDETLGESGGYVNRFEDSYIGVTLKGGLLARPNKNFTFGLVVESPLEWQVEQTYIDEDGIRDVIEYDLLRPFIIGSGISYRMNQLRFTGEIEYIDWSQLSYDDNPGMEIENDSLNFYYRDVLNLRGGVEYELPKRGLAFRAGLFSQPLAYEDDFIESDRKGFTLGFGWLIDKVLLLEAAYVKGSFERNYTAPNAFYTVIDNNTAIAKDDFQRIYFTLSYRN
ncbi:MAG: hypothetical protein V3V99_04245 [candidate division Zixibacteria bacterium]